MTGRSGLRMAMAVALGAAAAALAPAGAGAAGYIPGKDCREQQAFVEGDPAAVASRLPAGYTAMRSPASGRPIVFARGLRCSEQTVGGRTAPGVMASYGILIDSPDGRGCGSASPAGTVKGDVPPVCNWYVLAWLASDRRVVDLLREETSGFPAHHVPGLVFDLGQFDPITHSAPFTFRAGGPSPYTIEATMREGSRELSVRGAYWADTPQGRVKVALSTDDLTAAGGDGVVRTRAGTELAALLGAEERPYADPYAEFASVRAKHGVYRKQILPEPGSTAGFAGACSLKGTVTFKPPAGYTPQPLAYDYTAAGTCSGTLDGREVEDAAVRVYQAGRSEGGCREAKTVEPGRGTMTFETGEAVRYTLDFTTQSTEINGTLYGERSGQASARATFRTDRTPPDVAVRCAQNAVSEIPMDATFTTAEPLVNEPPVRPLRLSVTPRRVRSGRRTSFGFRVRTADRRPVAGALVRFYGRRVTTNAAGRATVVAKLKRPGAHPVRAKRAGFRTAQATIHVAGGRR